MILSLVHIYFTSLPTMNSYSNNINYTPVTINNLVILKLYIYIYIYIYNLYYIFNIYIYVYYIISLTSSSIIFELSI